MEQKYSIERNSPTIKASFGLGIIALTWYNTSLYRFPQKYQHIDHIHYIDEEKQRYNIFGNPELMNILQRENFPVMTAQEPSDNDIESYFEYESKQLEKRINGI